MDLANITLALGGDKGHTVRKRLVTAAEIAVLRSIHGEDSVFDVEPAEKVVNRSNRDELNRLRLAYGGALDSEGNSIVNGLFPGAAARVFEMIAELELPDELFQTTERTAAKPNKAAPAALPAQTAPVKKSRRGKAAKTATAPEPLEPAFEDDPEDDTDEDGIGDMNDSVMG